MFLYICFLFILTWSTIGWYFNQLLKGNSITWIIEGCFYSPCLHLTIHEVYVKVFFSKLPKNIAAQSYTPVDLASVMLRWWHILPGSSPSAARVDSGSARTAAWSWSGTAARAARRRKRSASPPSFPCDLMGNHCLESCPACSLRVRACNDMKWHEWVCDDTCS